MNRRRLPPKPGRITDDYYKNVDLRYEADILRFCVLMEVLKVEDSNESGIRKVVTTNLKNQYGRKMIVRCHIELIYTHNHGFH